MAEVFEVHPRVRGVQCRVMPVAAPIVGPSPRARGSAPATTATAVHSRSIPACAGFSPTELDQFESLPVHPRVRGVQTLTTDRKEWLAGPSPRARGSDLACCGLPLDHRSIPACAGFSSGPGDHPGHGPVHPRVRGVQGK